MGVKEIMIIVLLGTAQRKTAVFNRLDGNNTAFLREF
jgi:hypothetical protein